MEDPWESLALGPDQTYEFAPDMAAELAELLAETAELAAGPATRLQRRMVLLRQLALIDRLCEVSGGALGASRLKLAAAHLVDFDLKHGGCLGGLPTSERAWELDPIGYVRQEYTELLNETPGVPTGRPEFVGVVGMTPTEIFMELECTQCGWTSTSVHEFEEHADTGPARRLAEEHNASHGGT